jgi:sugar/nucleoside kinase (ribokinase family)
MSVGTAEPMDVFIAGRVFLDIIFTGMLRPPSGGHEIWTDGMGSSPGGVANLAVACSRLGLATAMSAAFGGDAYGDYCWKELSESENIDLSHSRRFPEWHSPVTVSLAFDNDRAMVTHEHPPPVPAEELLGEVPLTRLAFADVGVDRATWVDTMVANGTKIFTDAGWDSTEVWDTTELRERLEGCHAFVPNAAEAMAYTKTKSPGAAVEELREWLPLAVVTAGSGGAFAADASTGETAWVPGVQVEALDPTGAGDVFLAGLMTGELEGWSLVHRLRFANLCAALSVRDFGGALAAPGWIDIAHWWAAARSERRFARDYEFLDDVLPIKDQRPVSRAVPTIGFATPVLTPPKEKS